MMDCIYICDSHMCDDDVIDDIHCEIEWMWYIIMLRSHIWAGYYWTEHGVAPAWLEDGLCVVPG